MSVRYKFKNDLQFNTLPCDGFDVSLRDLKKAVVRAKKFGRMTDFDLVVTNEQTSQVYNNDEDLIPKNSTLIIARHPLPSGQKKVWEEEKLAPSTTNSINSSSTATSKGTSASSAISGGAFKKHDTEAESATEDDKITAMMDESTKMYASENWQNFRGRGRGSWGRGKIGGPPPVSYVCVSCNQSGHWRNDCPIGGKGLGQEIKRTTGIPRSFLTPVPVGTPGAKMTPTGILMGIEMEKQAYETKKTEKPIWDSDETEVNLTSVKNGVEIPPDLICPVCKDLLKDAIMMPECGCSMCDECARDSLINSDKNECPDCGEANNSPDDLIPWRQLRDKVNNFKNESGYNKPNKQADVLEKPNPVPLGVKPTLPDIYLPDPKDVNFDKVVNNGQVLPPTEPIATAESPVYGMAGPSPPNYAVSPGQQLVPSGFDNSSPNSNQVTTEISSGVLSHTSTVIDSEIPVQSKSRSISPAAKSRSPSKERIRTVSGSESQAPGRRDSRRSSSGSGASPTSRAVSFTDTSLPPPSVHPINSNSTATCSIPQDNLNAKLSNQMIPDTNTSAGLAGVATNGTLPPVIGPPPGTYAVRLPATVPSHLPPPATQIASHDHPHQQLHIPPSIPHIPPSHPPGTSQPLPPYNLPPPRHVMHDVPHDLRRGPPPGHGIPPPHLPPRNMYGIDKDGYIDDPLAAFERAMAMKDASKGRIPPPRYDGRGMRRRYYSPEPSHRYSSRSPPRYRDRRSPFHRRSPTPPHYRDRRQSRSPMSFRPRISKSPEDRGPQKGPKTPPHPHPIREGSTTPPDSTARHESPPPPPGTQSPESRMSPSRRNTLTPEKDSMENITSTTQQTSTESKENESSRSPAPLRSRSVSSKEKDIKRHSSSPQPPKRDSIRSPGPYYRRTPPPSDQYRYSPSRRHSPPGMGVEYPNHNHEYYYRHERHAPPPPEEFYDHRRAGDYVHPPREIYGNQRDSAYGARDRYPPHAPYYRNEYRERGRGYGYRGRGRGHNYNQFYPDNRRNYYHEEHTPHYQRNNHDFEGSRRDHHASKRSRSRDRSPTQRNRADKSTEREVKAKNTVTNTTSEPRRKEKSNSRDRTPSLTPEPEFKEQQERIPGLEGQEQKDRYAKTEYCDLEFKNAKADYHDKNEKEKSELQDRNSHDGRKNIRNNKSTERNTDSGRTRSRSKSYERKERVREKEKRSYEKRDHRWDSSRTRNRDQDYHRSRDRRDAESNYKDRPRQSSVSRERNDRISDDRYHSKRRDYDSSNKDSRDDRQHRRNNDGDRKTDRLESSVKDNDTESPKDSEIKEKKRKDKKKKKKRDESGNESEDHSETGQEKKKKKMKKDKKVKSIVKGGEQKPMNGSKIVDDKVGEEIEDHVVLHNQETFEDCISNLEDVLVKADKLTNNESEQSIDDHTADIASREPVEMSKWEKNEEDPTNKDSNESAADRDLREILKAKSSLSSITNIPNSTNSKSVKKNNENDLEYDKSGQQKTNDQEDSIDIHVDSEYDEIVGSSDKEGKKAKMAERQSDSGSDEKTAKKKRKKEKKDKKHKSKDSKKERKKSKKMLKELLGKDGLEELLSKLDGSQLPEDVLAKAVLSRTEREISRSPSPFPLKSRERKDYDYRTPNHYSRDQGKESSSRRAVISDGKSLKMTIDRNSPREEHTKGGKGDYVRRRSRDRSLERNSRRRSRSPRSSRSPNRKSRSDRSSSKREETLDSTSSRLMEMSMNSSSRLTTDNGEPTKKLSIKDRLGPIRAPSGEDRQTSSSKNISKRKLNEDSHDFVHGKSRWNESSTTKSGKEERSNNSRKSADRKEKWNSQEDRNNRRKDKELISESSPPPSKRSRDSSESKDETNKNNDWGQSPTTKDSHRTSLKDKKAMKRDIESDEEDNDRMSNTSRNKRTSSRLDKNSK